jgi:hypothetical protein
MNRGYARSGAATGAMPLAGEQLAAALTATGTVVKAGSRVGFTEGV